MHLNKHQLRKLVNEEVKRIENKKQLNELAGATVFKKSIKSILKSFGLAIPGIDIWLGTIIASADMVAIKLATDRMIADLPIVGDSILNKLLSTDKEWNNVLLMVQALPEDQRDVFRGLFDELLESIKDLVLTLIQAYDSAVVAIPAGTAAAGSFGAGGVAVEVVTNLTTGLGSLIASMMPIERFLFSSGTKIAAALQWILSFIKENNPDHVLEMGANGGEILTMLIDSPVLVFIRLGQLYDALHNEEETGLSSLKNISAKDAISSIADITIDSIPLSESRFIKLAGIK